ncbi:hypothetical protein BDV37DRAFT_263325 [Aspergillus pseudonomiae]|uniref:Uncharacterized protein n=1 Tax=Aspergillus pseudonomiae TaxID=1506151 RepID=A0A5N7CWT7_9EURO|nr:uncharacterized protein BDV37DRAFT_263325 [Aspergillus pseudonomiae]KAE8398429.1 hypothetical protein BDV37DRAFT_263325 [Aspergillus pseudonomiae]
MTERTVHGLTSVLLRGAFHAVAFIIACLPGALGLALVHLGSTWKNGYAEHEGNLLSCE